ncbi:NadS family protein [Escherichia coli]
MSFFDELKTSLEEAVEIKQGLKEPARVTRYEIADVKAIREQLNVSQGIWEWVQKNLRHLRENPASLQLIHIHAFSPDAMLVRRIRHFSITSQYACT